ncbi:MAG: alpha/beta fold hydrolase, partial [Proteobacteria bacterium]|nr:alpha/beta fold hydrolase [Pseudomonadota bacterium]
MLVHAAPHRGLAVGSAGRLQTATSSATEDSRSFTFGPFSLNLVERSLRRQGRAVPIGARAFDILTLLVQRAGEVVRHDELVAHVWQGIRVSAGTPRVHLTALRKALDCRPDRTRYIANIPGRGYCFVAPVIAGRNAEAGDSEHLAPTPGQSPQGAGWFQVKQGTQAGHAAAAIAQQILATHSTAHASIAGTFLAGRALGAGDGLLPEREASIPTGSRAASATVPVWEGEEQEMARMKLGVAAAITLLTYVAGATPPAAHAQPASPAAENVTHYRNATVEGVDLFYREAGPQNAPAVVLLHGFPTSSHMFRNLIPILANRYRVIAPDYPGFGQSAAPDHTQFAYTFAHYATLVNGLLENLGVGRYAMYVMDYGAPVGYRLALMHPERVTALIVQNGNAYAEGLGAFWDPIKAYW